MLKDYSWRKKKPYIIAICEFKMADQRLKIALLHSSKSVKVIKKSMKDESDSVTVFKFLIYNIEFLTSTLKKKNFKEIDCRKIHALNGYGSYCHTTIPFKNIFHFSSAYNTAYSRSQLLIHSKHFQCLNSVVMKIVEEKQYENIKKLLHKI